MATVAITFPVGAGTTSYAAGSALRGLARKLERAAAQVGDNNPSGASVVLTFDNTQTGQSAGFFTLAGGSIASTITTRF